MRPHRDRKFVAGSPDTVRRLMIIGCLGILWPGLAVAVMTPEEELQARIEAKIYSGCGARKLLKDDICEIAQETRAFVKQLIAQGLTEEQILDALKERYGPSILAIPERNWLGSFSYAVPYIVALLGLSVVTYFLRRSSSGSSSGAPEAPAPSLPEDRRKEIERQVLSDL